MSCSVDMWFVGISEILPLQVDEQSNASLPQAYCPSSWSFRSRVAAQASRPTSPTRRWPLASTSCCGTRSPPESASCRYCFPESPKTGSSERVSPHFMPPPWASASCYSTRLPPGICQLQGAISPQVMQHTRHHPKYIKHVLLFQQVALINGHCDLRCQFDSDTILHTHLRRLTL